MKIKKVKKLLLGLLPISVLPIAITTISASVRNDGLLIRDLSKYDILHKQLWDHLKIQGEEFSNKETKIGIIDGGLVDSNILKFDGNSKLQLDLNKKYSLINDNERLNKNRVKYFEDAVIQNPKEEDFLSRWKENEHSTNIASILGSDSGLFKNATFFSTTYHTKNGETKIERLRKNLEFFRSNEVKFINLSYGLEYLGDESYRTIKEILYKVEKNDFNFSSNYQKKLDNIINYFKYNYKIYNEFASLLDEYSFKYDMKFFISFGNDYDDYLELKNDINSIVSSFNTFLLKNQDNILLQKIKDSLIKILKTPGINKSLFLNSSFNTFVVSAYNIDSLRASYYSGAPVKDLKKTSLFSSPADFRVENLLLNKNNNRSEKWIGTSFSAPIGLGLSLLISLNNNKNYSVSYLRAALAASTERIPFIDIYSEDQRLGFGRLSWNRLKYYINKVQKLEASDFNKIKENSPTAIIKKRTNNSYLFVFSNLSMLFSENKNLQSDYDKNSKLLDENESYKLISPFYFKISTSPYLSTKKLYEKLHLSNYDIDLFEVSTNNVNIYKEEGHNPGTIPTEYEVQITIKNDTFLKEILDKGVYYILEVNDIFESDYVKYE